MTLRVPPPLLLGSCLYLLRTLKAADAFTEALTYLSISFEVSLFFPQATTIDRRLLPAATWLPPFPLPPPPPLPLPGILTGISPTTRRRRYAKQFDFLNFKSKTIKLQLRRTKDATTMITTTMTTTSSSPPPRHLPYLAPQSQRRHRHPASSRDRRGIAFIPPRRLLLVPFHGLPLLVVTTEALAVLKESE